MVDAHPDAASRDAAEHKLATPREVRIEELLLHGERELLIRHGEELYHLRITKNGRLLLTK
jgi:hemin uptake protein HemP